MPAYGTQDPRHPVNRSRLMHHAAVEAWGEGAVIPPDAWRLAQVKVFGAKDRPNLWRDTQKMEDLCMVILHPKRGVELRPLSAESLPLVMDSLE